VPKSKTAGPAEQARLSATWRSQGALQASSWLPDLDVMSQSV
jgi:hypothetical protein